MIRLYKLDQWLDLAVGYIVAALVAPIDAAVSYFWRRRRR